MRKKRNAQSVWGTDSKMKSPMRHYYVESLRGIQMEERLEHSRFIAGQSTPVAGALAF